MPVLLFLMTTTKNALAVSRLQAKNKFLPWIEVSPAAPYFITETGENWTPIGQNDAITWPELQGLFRRKNLQSVENYLQMLAAHGVTCLRLMLEYCQTEHRYFEKPAGQFTPNMIRLWDDLFALCEKYGLRILWTPYDTFWMWIRWSRHPYNKKNAGPCAARNQWLLCKETRAAIKARLAFATERWGGSGALFAWDLWNEIHPSHAQNKSDQLFDFIDDISHFLRETELRLHGRAHPQTVSVFQTVAETDALVVENIYRHPGLQFANSHLYEHPSINHPNNTVDAALAVGRLVRKALQEIQDNRPFFDSEHGPIHTFKDKKITLPEDFDDEYFRHMQWAHLASGGAGGGMRWPNRHPHTLTPGMRVAQHAMAQFLPWIDWKNFKRKNWNEEVKGSPPTVHVFACGDENQALIWLLRKDINVKNNVLNQEAEQIKVQLQVPIHGAGTFEINCWNTKVGEVTHSFRIIKAENHLLVLDIPALKTDLALAVRRL